MRLLPVLPDFAVFRKEGAIDRVADSAEKIELDEERGREVEGAGERWSLPPAKMNSWFSFWFPGNPNDLPTEKTRPAVPQSS